MFFSWFWCCASLICLAIFRHPSACSKYCMPLRIVPLCRPLLGTVSLLTGVRSIKLNLDQIGPRLRLTSTWIILSDGPVGQSWMWTDLIGYHGDCARRRMVARRCVRLRWRVRDELPPGVGRGKGDD